MDNCKIAYRCRSSNMAAFRLGYYQQPVSLQLFVSASQPKAQEGGKYCISHSDISIECEVRLLQTAGIVDVINER